MTPKEKAQHLYKKMYFSIVGVEMEVNRGNAKRCAIEAVDEILTLNLYDDCLVEKEHGGYLHLYEYFREIKKEIESIQ